MDSYRWNCRRKRTIDEIGNKGSSHLFDRSFEGFVPKPFPTKLVERSFQNKNLLPNTLDADDNLVACDIGS